MRATDMLAQAERHSLYVLQRFCLRQGASVHAMCYTSLNGAAKIHISIDTEKKRSFTVYEAVGCGYETTPGADGGPLFRLNYA